MNFITESIKDPIFWFVVAAMLNNLAISVWIKVLYKKNNLMENNMEYLHNKLMELSNRCNELEHQIRRLI